MLRKVISTFSVNGFHAWEGAPLRLSYLSARHRHLFIFKVEVRVTNDDRQVEFHELQRAARHGLDEHPRGGNGEYEFGGKSCEMLADMLFRNLASAGWNVTAVECWEDNECGARVEKEAFA